MKTIAVTGAGPEVGDGLYRLVRRHEDGAILLEPTDERSLGEIEHELGLSAVASDELDRLLGHLFSDREG